MADIQVEKRIETTFMQNRLIVSINPMPRGWQAVRLLQERIEKLPGVKSVSIHAQTEMAYVVFEARLTGAEAIIAAINDQTFPQGLNSELDPHDQPNDD